MNHTERREKRLQIQGIYEDKPLLDGKAARTELKELNFRQENRLAALKQSLKQNLEEIKETKKQLRTGVAKEEEASSEATRDNRVGVGRRRQPKTFAEQVNRYSDRIDAMIEERMEREVTKIQDRRLKAQILKNRAEREGKELESEGGGDATHAETAESREETVATERERRPDLDELIRRKQEEIEGLQKQKLLKRLSEQVENEL